MGPGFAHLDFSLLKNIELPLDGYRLQFRFEVFNRVNHPNWHVPFTDVRNIAQFGRVSSARNMREIQFALKYSF